MGKQQPQIGRKKDIFDYLPSLIIAAVCIMIGAWLGYIAELTASPKHGIQWLKALNALSDYMTVGDFVSAQLAVFGFSYSFYGALVGLFIGFIVFALMSTKEEKRYQRKGTEHGSARWGNNAEKRSIADTNDFYNNMILAQDIFLVLDRKKREENKLSKKQLEAKRAKDDAEKVAEEKRKETLTVDLSNHIASRNTELEFDISEKGVLLGYNGTLSDVILPETVSEIAPFAFAANKEIRSVVIPKNTEKICKAAFYSCENLESAEIYSSVIEESAFEDCKNLKSVTLTSVFRTADKTSFKACDRLTMQLPQSSAAEKYATANGIFYKLTGAKADNEAKISINDITRKAVANKKIETMLSLNTLIFGGTGTGKSRFYAKPNMMQCNTSYIITDPSGELLRDCGKMLERNGYVIKVFNVYQMEYSGNYNPFHYVRDSSGKYNESYVIKMINVFMENTKGGDGNGGDPFWDNATKLLLSAVCFLLIETADEEQQNFSNVLDIIHKAKVAEGQKEKSQLDIIFEEHKKDDPKALSCQYYDEFKQSAEKTMQSILISTTTRLQYFKLEQVKNLTWTDNIHLEEVGDRKTALFIIIPSQDRTYNFLAAMMYTQLFDSLYDRAISKYQGRLPVHVSCILDEFANIGKIPGFEELLATMRKFGISAQIILQNLSQLKSMYEKSWNAIPGNCDTTIFLGGRDQSNNEYL